MLEYAVVKMLGTKVTKYVNYAKLVDIVNLYLSKYVQIQKFRPNILLV